MMGHQARSEALFYNFRLDDQVPENHLLAVDRPAHQFRVCAAATERQLQRHWATVSRSRAVVAHSADRLFVRHHQRAQTGGRTAHASGLAVVYWAGVRSGDSASLDLFQEPAWTIPGVRTVDGGRTETVYGTTYNSVWVRSWSPEGKLLFVDYYNAAGKRSIGVLSLTEHKLTELNSGAEAVSQRSINISPDGRWIAYVTDQSGQEEVYIQDYPGPGKRVQISYGTELATGSNWSEMPRSNSGRVGRSVSLTYHEQTGTQLLKCRLYSQNALDPFAARSEGYNSRTHGPRLWHQTWSL